jgi:hypothetical protein
MLTVNSRSCLSLKISFWVMILGLKSGFMKSKLKSCSKKCRLENDRSRWQVATIAEHDSSEGGQ